MVTFCTLAGKAAIPLSISDAAVKAKTGKVWNEWFKILDAAGAKRMTHQEIVALLSKKHGVGPWWQQMVTVTYEQARGLRKVHQKPGGFEISVSRTIDAPIARSYKAWTEARTRQKWLSAEVTIRKATANKSLRLNWEDGKTIVAAAFLGKGEGKTQVVAQHNKLPDAKSAAKMKKFWGEALDQLKETLE
jgi:uncharacterized protein YndB with AHSA1/START domain